MVLPERQYVEAGGMRLSYREAGSGPALFFVHGMGGNSGNWQTQYDQFSDRFRVIGWDAPGYGDSDSFDTDTPSTGDYVMLMADFLDALGVEKTHLVGHSYGGIMAAGFHRAFRDRLLSLTLAEPVVGGGVEDMKDRQESIKAREEEVKKLGVDGFAELHAPRSCAPDADPEVVKKGVEVTRQMNIDGYLTQFRSLRHANIFEWAVRPRVPAMIVGGEHDRTAMTGMIDDIAEKMPGIEKHIIPDIGHMIYLEYPERFNALLEDLLARA